MTDIPKRNIATPPRREITLVASIDLFLPGFFDKKRLLPKKTAKVSLLRTYSGALCPVLTKYVTHHCASYSLITTVTIT